MRAPKTRRERAIAHYLFASDFDQTLSFNDSGTVLTELIGASGFDQKVAGLARTHLVHQGAELAYLLRHDPEFRMVRREHLVEAGRRVRLKKDIAQLMNFFKNIAMAGGLLQIIAFGAGSFSLDGTY